MEKSSLLFLTVTLLSFLHSTSGIGDLTYGQSCNPVNGIIHLDSSTQCDTAKRLSCSNKERTCACHHEDRDIYNPDKDQCETKIGKFCTASESFPTICVKTASCDATSSFCVCEEGSAPNEEETECHKVPIVVSGGDDDDDDDNVDDADADDKPGKEEDDDDANAAASLETLNSARICVLMGIAIAGAWF